jgi:hypothetical protein
LLSPTYHGVLHMISPARKRVDLLEYGSSPECLIPILAIGLDESPWGKLQLAPTELF